VAEHTPRPKPPWPTKVKVTYASDMFYSLELGPGGLEAEVHWDGGWYVKHESRQEIRDYMELDQRLTRKIQVAFEATYPLTKGGYIDWARRWVKGTLGEYEIPEPVHPKDWVPGQKRPKKTSGRQGTLIGADSGWRSDNTYNWDSATWWGGVFEFVHFKDLEENEGAIIYWQEGGDVCGNYTLPQVWMGDFGEFMSSQEEQDPKSWETFLHWNRIYENALLWAFDELGVFEGKENWVGNPREPVIHGPTKQVVDAILEAPEILYPSLIEKIFEHGDILPKELWQLSARIMDQQRREEEAAQGQQRFWEPPDLNL